MDEDEETADDIKYSNESEGANWIITYFAKNYEDQFLKVAKDLGYPFSHKMMPETATAMWQDANVCHKAQRITLRYLRNKFGTRVDIPGGTAGKFGQEHIPPECSYFETPEKKKIHYWTKPIDTVVTTCVKKYLEEQKLMVEKKELKSVDVVFGGDHGQGKFRAVVKVIYRDESGKTIDYVVMTVAHIDCRKDTYDILKNTVATKINESLKKLHNSGRLSIAELYDNDSTDSYSVTLYDEEDKNSNLTHVRIRIFVTGDLAFYAAALGKINMSGFWCTWCNLCVSEWEKLDHSPGTCWTIDDIAQCRKDYQIGTVPKTAYNRKGCVDTPLIDCVDINSYVFPVLHVMIGLGNKLISDFFRWVDLRVDMIPKEEIRIRKEWQLSIDAMEGKRRDLDEWDRQNKTELAQLLFDRDLARELKESRVVGTTGTFEFSVDERKEMKEVIKSWTTKIDALQADRIRYAKVVATEKKT